MHLWWYNSKIKPQIIVLFSRWHGCKREWIIDVEEAGVPCVIKPDKKSRRPPYSLTYNHCQSWGSNCCRSGEKLVFCSLRYIDITVTCTCLFKIKHMLFDFVFYLAFSAGSKFSLSKNIAKLFLYMWQWLTKWDQMREKRNRSIFKSVF